MANTKDIRIQINSTKKTQQTTRAMKVVSAAKLKKAQHNIVNARPYALSLGSVIRKIAMAKKIHHPLLEDSFREDAKTLLIVVTSDRGLCGAFNANIIRYTNEVISKFEKGQKNFDLGFIGKKGASHFKSHGKEGVIDILNLSRTIDYKLAAEVADNLLDRFLSGLYSEIRLIYNEFKSTMTQEVVDERILPLTSSEDIESNEINSEFIFEPTASEIIDELLKKHFAVQIYRIFQESVASEHGARMSAMENATRNAGERIDTLTLTYNKMRQSAITTELIEITSGAEALNG